jgi:hypothetical protein
MFQMLQTESSRDRLCQVDVAAMSSKSVRFGRERVELCCVLSIQPVVLPVVRCKQNIIIHLQRSEIPLSHRDREK